MNNVSFGLDFGGLTTKKTTLVRADLSNEGDLYFIVIENHPLVNNDLSLVKIKNTQEQLFKPIIDSGKSVYIDVPIDLQNLKFDTEVIYFWQLTKRPVDYVFNAIAPLGDRIGSMVATFRYILLNPSKKRNSFSNVKSMEKMGLGKQIFETYPKQSIKFLTDLEANGYKNGSLIYDVNQHEFMVQNDVTILKAKQYFDGLAKSEKAKKLYQLLEEQQKYEILFLLGRSKKSEDTSSEEGSENEMKTKDRKVIRDYLINENVIEEPSDLIIKKYNLKQIKSELVKKYQESIINDLSIVNGDKLLLLFNKVFENKEVKCEGDICIDDDEFDAIICSMTGLLANMSGVELRDYLKCQLRTKDTDECKINNNELIPVGYRLLAKNSLKDIRTINIKKANWNIDLITKSMSDLWQGI